MTGGTLGLLARLVLSLGVVLALMWVAARVVRGSLAGRSSGAIEVLARQQLGRGAAVTIVRVADRALVIGVTENGVSLLTETDLESVLPVEGAPAEFAAPDGWVPRVPAQATVARTTPSRANPLTGSILSPSTWRRSIEVLRDRTARR